MKKATKWIKLALIGSSVIVAGCQRRLEDTLKQDGQASSGTRTHRAHVFPGWWWWYVHRPYFASPMYGTGVAHQTGSGGSYVRRPGGGYVGARSHSGSRLVTSTFGGSRPTTSGTRTGVSGRGGFSGGPSIS